MIYLVWIPEKTNFQLTVGIWAVTGVKESTKITQPEILVYFILKKSKASFLYTVNSQ